MTIRKFPKKYNAKDSKKKEIRYSQVRKYIRTHIYKLTTEVKNINMQQVQHDLFFTMVFSMPTGQPVSVSR